MRDDDGSKYLVEILPWGRQDGIANQSCLQERQSHCRISHHILFKGRRTSFLRDDTPPCRYPVTKNGETAGEKIKRLAFARWSFGLRTLQAER